MGVERKSKTSIKRMYAQCKACVREGWSLVIFPQGTRNRRTTLPFKDGAFNLAAELDLRVLPVSIHIPEDVRIRRKEGRNERTKEGTKERRNERTKERTKICRVVPMILLSSIVLLD